MSASQLAVFAVPSALDDPSIQAYASPTRSSMNVSIENIEIFRYYISLLTYGCVSTHSWFKYSSCLRAWLLTFPFL